MRAVLAEAAALLRGDVEADRMVPRSGADARLTVFVSGAMAFLAVFALALSMAAGRLADRWDDALARTATVRISAPAGELDAQTEAVLRVLSQTPGVAEARALTREEERALLEPWFGADLPLDDLPIPRLVELVEAGEGYDAEGLRQRLAAEAPGAVLDDHGRWRRPLVEAAARLRAIGWLALGLIAGSMAALVTLAAGASLSANRQVIEVLRLVGARDGYIVRAFTRRFTIRAAAGALGGTAAGLVALALLPRSRETFLTDLGFSGADWAISLSIPALAGIVAFLSTRRAAFRMLETIR